MTPQLLDLLSRVSDYLEDHMDVIDGPEGQQLPNDAMALHTEIAGVVSPHLDKLRMLNDWQLRQLGHDPESVTALCLN